MINPDEVRPISFRAGEMPVLSEIPQEEIERDLEERERRSKENLQRLYANEWSPFGEEW